MPLPAQCLCQAEAAAVLTAEGRSPGELDLMNYAEQQAGVAGREA